MKPSAEPPVGAPSSSGSVVGASLLVRPYAPVQLNGAASAGGGGGASALGVISTAPTAVESATAATLPNNSFFIASFLCRPGAPEPPLVGPRPIAGIVYIMRTGLFARKSRPRPVNVSLCP